MGWWLEEGLAYENARLRKRLIETGLTTECPLLGKPVAIPCVGS